MRGGQDHVVAVLVEFDDLRFGLATDVGGEVADATHLDEGGGLKPRRPMSRSGLLTTSMTVPVTTPSSFPDLFRICPTHARTERASTEEVPFLSSF